MSLRVICISPGADRPLHLHKQAPTIYPMVEPIIVHNSKAATTAYRIFKGMVTRGASISTIRTNLSAQRARPSRSLDPMRLPVLWGRSRCFTTIPSSPFWRPYHQFCQRIASCPAPPAIVSFQDIEPWHNSCTLMGAGILYHPPGAGPTPPANISSGRRCCWMTLVRRKRPVPKRSQRRKAQCWEKWQWTSKLSWFEDTSVKLGHRQAAWPESARHSRRPSLASRIVTSGHGIPAALQARGMNAG